ncbi:CD209 antigen-like protein D isoform X2 [Engraulis encrasicolus]|uniref:CD209 antigen-like protein D isoform X2 n=1 Tax=Engraulis encrasicolus TaxID=184585 RepID=UPI002FCF3AED
MYVKFCNYFGNYAEGEKAVEWDKPTTEQSGVPNFRLFRSLAAILSIVCLVLLAVIVALAIKLQTQTICPEEVDGSVVSVCSRDQCGSLYTQRQVHACSCQECGEGWTEFQGFCFFLSRTRNTWLDSRADCQSKGGDLAVIDQDSIKTFLSQKAKDLYWIGLRRSDTHWTWVDHSAAGPGNWSTKPGQDCVYMDGNAKASRSWKTEDCSSVTYYICQKTR